MRFIITAILALALPFMAHAESDFSLSVFADTGMSFTNHTDAGQEIQGGYTYIPNAFGPNEPNVIINKVKAPLQVGNYQLPSGFDGGLDVAWKSIGVGFGYRQTFPMSIRHAQVTYSGADTNKVQSFDGSAVTNALYFEPFIHIRQGQNSFLNLGCKVGQANMDGTLKSAWADGNFSYDADFHYTSTAMFVEPSIRQGWFLNKHFALSLELSYCFLQFTEMQVDNGTNVKSHTTPPSGFSIFPVGPRPAFQPPKPDFTVDASSFSVRIRLDSFLFNAFLNPPPPPKIDLPVLEELEPKSQEEVKS